ncbi:MAG: HPr family phosphocarrier protein [Desulfohalobiaceae bacterium]|nr:HPr family phosphocarrier protein [Desulfohalobiaceae bacterium]
MQKEEIRLDVSVCQDMGLHARPAAQLAREAGSFESDIYLVLDGDSADAKSVLDILSLAAVKGTRLSVVASGPDAAEAVEQLRRFFCNESQETETTWPEQS